MSKNLNKTNSVELLKQTNFLGKTLSVFGTVVNPIFLAKEVADWLEHSNSRMMLQSIDEDEKVVRNVYTLGGKQSCCFLTEYGLYEVLMQSRKPIAKEFKKGVKAILKEIRQQGYYVAPNVKGGAESEVESLLETIKFQDGLIEFKDRQIDFKDQQIDTLNNRVDKLLTMIEKYYETPKQPDQPKQLQSGEMRILKKSTVCGKPVTVFGTPDNPLFYAKEIAEVFGVVCNVNMVRYVSEQNKQRLRNPADIFGGHKTWFINKAGLDELAYRYAYCGCCVDYDEFNTDIETLLQTIR
jgi:prophage antirepressor-like protein